MRVSRGVGRTSQLEVQSHHYTFFIYNKEEAVIIINALPKLTSNKFPINHKTSLKIGFLVIELVLIDLC